jgi:Fe-S-cluster-containing dehydrogenase component
MLIQTEMCLGCDVCLKACKAEFVGNDFATSAGQPDTTYGFGPFQTYGWPDTPSTAMPWVSHGQNWMDMAEVTTGTFPTIKTRYTPRPCMQCDNAPCVTAATNGAVTKRADGIVLIDPQKSVRQPQIVASCPYNRVYWNPSSLIPQKCTFCAHLVDAGQKPRCVDACPVAAITFGNLDDANSDISKKIVSLKAVPLNPEFGTNPKVYYSGL